MMISFFIGLLLFFGSQNIVELYTNIKEVQEETVVVLKYLALFHQTDSLQGVSSGILRGIGKTKHASVAGIISYWIISLPLEYLWGFKLGYGVLGLWYG
jgi:MATE family multidrug resistance protein